MLVVSDCSVSFDDSGSPNFLPYNGVDHLEFLTLDYQHNSRELDTAAASPKSKRKRQHRDKLPRSFEGPGVFPQAGETEWDPSKLQYHTGKWPIEEERYANRLVLEFEAGVLEDCRDGVTLRSYLAKTLRCAPMRVSKKLAGKCIGSKVFCRQGGDRKVFLQKIANGELKIPSLQRRTKQSSNASNKPARSRSPFDITDDEISSGSSSCTEDDDTGSDNQTMMTSSKRKYVMDQNNYPAGNMRQGPVQQQQQPDQEYVQPCPLLSDFESNIYDYGADFYLSDVTGSTGDNSPHAPDLGYDEWRDALSYFKETETISTQTDF